MEILSGLVWFGISGSGLRRFKDVGFRAILDAEDFGLTFLV